MTGLDSQGPQRRLHGLRPLPSTEAKATFAASDAVLARLGLAPADTAGLDLADILRLISETEQRVHACACNLTDPASIRDFASSVTQHTDRVDILINNGLCYLEGPDLQSASDAMSSTPSHPVPRARS